ncbi:ABC transporter substrate-binding protein [Gordonia sp. VNQ95]|jgi:polar amino acid transport system substrate-binding protein|uniref:ABC transporter substrate-binding protein n=1 Tax=Gordonia TaxID=2053 RepID=UPI0032B3EDE0
MSRHRSFVRRVAALAVGGVIAATALSACAGASADDTATPGSVVVGAVSNGAAKEVTLSVPQVDSIRGQLPQEVRDSGELSIGIGALPSGYPPLAFVGSDQHTLTGAEPDLGRLVASVFGLKPVIENSTWENLFVGIDSGRVDVGFSNITVTEERKDKYDFASYRRDQLAFEVPASSSWNFDGDYHTLAGKTVAVNSGTNQERILLAWRDALASEGKTLTVVHFPDSNATNLALASGKIDTYLGPNPSISYHVRQTANTPKATRIAGTYSGAGASLQGMIAATTKKGSGLAAPIAAAINHLIETGVYAKWIAAWNLSAEAVPASQINPPGLPRSDS